MNVFDEFVEIVQRLEQSRAVDDEEVETLNEILKYARETYKKHSLNFRLIEDRFQKGSDRFIALTIVEETLTDCRVLVDKESTNQKRREYLGPPNECIYIEM